MKKCPQCGYKNADFAKLCKICKAKLPHEPTLDIVAEPVKVSRKKHKESE